MELVSHVLPEVHKVLGKHAHASDAMTTGACHWPPTTGNLLLTACYRPPATGGLRTIGRLLLAACFCPPSTARLLLAAYS